MKKGIFIDRKDLIGAIMKTPVCYLEKSKETKLVLRNCEVLEEYLTYGFRNLDLDKVMSFGEIDRRLDRNNILCKWNECGYIEVDDEIISKVLYGDDVILEWLLS